MASTSTHDYQHHHHHHHHLHQHCQTPDTVFQQTWSPCTRGLSINDYTQNIHFPISFRFLREQWESQNRPELENLEWPRGLSYGSPGSVPNSIDDVSSLQEIMSLSSIAGYLREGIYAYSKQFEEVASHIHLYSNLKAELDAKYHGWSKEVQEELYQENWRQCLINFEHDRAFCRSIGRHDCISELLWGDIVTMSTEEISHRYQQLYCKYQYSPSLSSPIIIQSQQHRRHAISFAPESSVSSSYPESSLSLTPALDDSIPWISEPSSSRGATPLYHYQSIVSPQEQYSSSSPSPKMYGEEEVRGIPIHYGDQASLYQVESQSNCSQPSGTFASSSPCTSTQSQDTVEKKRKDNRVNEARAEQNRIKSKKYYLRRKFQRNLLRDILASFELTLIKMKERGLDETKTNKSLKEIISAQSIPSHLQTTSEGEEEEEEGGGGGGGGFKTIPKTSNERKRLNKTAQKQLEIRRMYQVVSLADMMLRFHDQPSNSQLISLNSNEVARLKLGKEVEYQHALLQTWLIHQSQWNVLIEAEARLCLFRTKPINKLFQSLGVTF